MKKIYYILALTPLLAACNSTGLFDETPPRTYDPASREYVQPQRTENQAAKVVHTDQTSPRHIASSQNGSAMQVEPVKKATSKKPAAPAVPLNAPGMSGMTPAHTVAPVVPVQPVNPTPTAPVQTPPVQ